MDIAFASLFSQCERTSNDTVLLQERMRYIMDWNSGTHYALIYEIIVTEQHSL